MAKNYQVFAPNTLHHSTLFTVRTFSSIHEPVSKPSGRPFLPEILAPLPNTNRVLKLVLTMICTGTSDSKGRWAQREDCASAEPTPRHEQTRSSLKQRPSSTPCLESNTGRFSVCVPFTSS
jgi:hypothetical protein